MKAAKSFWLEQNHRETTFQGIAIKVYMIRSKPSNKSKAKEHLKILDGRLAMSRG